MSRSPSSADLRDLRSCACLALRRTTRAVTQLYDAVLRPYGLRATQLPILAEAVGRKRVPLALLAEELRMDRTTLLRNVRPLVRDGLVEVSPEAGSRRTEIRPTERGRARLAEVYPAWRDVQEQVTSRLSSPGWRQVLEDLEGTTGRGTARRQ